MRTSRFQIGDLIGRMYLGTKAFYEPNTVDPQVYKISQRKVFTQADLDLFTASGQFQFPDKSNPALVETLSSEQVYLVSYKDTFNPLTFREKIIVGKAPPTRD